MPMGAARRVTKARYIDRVHSSAPHRPAIHQLAVVSSSIEVFLARRVPCDHFRVNTAIRKVEGMWATVGIVTDRVSHSIITGSYVFPPDVFGDLAKHDD